MPIDQKGIASMLGLSQSTVSRALSDDPMIAVRTRKRVKELCDRLGYVPDYMASSLSSRKTRSIVALLNNPDYGFALSDLHSRWVAHLYSRAKDRGYKLRMEYADMYGTILTERSADGMIIFGEPGRVGLPSSPSAAPIPVVFTDCSASGNPGLVASDNIGGCCGAVRHLMDLGHREIAFFGYMKPSPEGILCSERHKGYSSALSDAGIASPSHYTIDQGVWPMEPEDCMVFSSPVLSLVEKGVTAFVASTDIGAIGIMKILSRNGCDVPRDLSVIGFDDTMLARACEPMLTTVRQDLKGLSDIAVDMLVGALDNGCLEDGVTVNAPLIIRGTTSVPRKNP